MTLFERIKTTAKKRGYSLSKVSEKAGLGAKTIYKWKKQTPKTETLQAVANVLGVSVDYLLGNTDNPNSDNAGDKKIDIEDEHVIMTYQGKPIPKEDMEIIKRLLRGK
ncbi:helix-turn-helix domain-containing protein [Loigolactobacillus rennini]|uniref:HTH cro/C1-type domain-containing protein n=1 Tax=Loigolactobacillus rennini DSM 20253 TaxID=1423796 RepID=A0A0R2CMW7_9LACO|nr:helix-turn-helix transcriptional regulator [Loigolactobacillus rennini]KRM92888.1 hypothetical protein FC24_GL000906 [Loigolactobacillus rennini DSM 20253]